MTLTFAPVGTPARPLHVVNDTECAAWCATQDAATQSWVRANSFTGAAGVTLLLPGADGTVAGAVVGLGTAEDAA
ncbi:MAG: leucyl aminopeptidase family protein, partial [Rhodobacterales bacterium]|nr:leucyl aminopeptidase family protein [Rhodobacterales bacterium]